MTQPFYLQVFSQEKWKHMSNKDLYKNVHGSFVWEAQTRATAHVSIDRQMDTHTMIHPSLQWILHNSKKNKWLIYAPNDWYMHQYNCAGQKKPHAQKSVMINSIYMKF